MDNEYIENIVGSPFVNERGWDQFKARMAPRINWRSKESPEIIQIKSLWKGFSKRLLNISQGVMQNTDLTSITPEQKTLTDQFFNLYRTIHAIEYKEKYSPAMSLKELLGSRDPSQKNFDQFLDDSKKKIIAAYNEFISSVSKVTGRTREKVAKFVSEISPQKYAKIIEKIQGFFSTPDLVPPVPPSTTGTPTPTAIPTTGTTPVTPTPSTTVPSTAKAGSSSLGRGKVDKSATLFVELLIHIVKKITAAVEGDLKHYNATGSEKRASELAAAAEKKAAAAAKAKSKSPAPLTSPASPAPTTTTTTTTTPINEMDYISPIFEADDDEGDDEGDDDKSIGLEPKRKGKKKKKFTPTGEFLYDFAGYYDKSRYFGVQIVSPDVTKAKEEVNNGEVVTLKSDGKPRYIKIIWSCNNFENIIRVEFKTDTGETKKRDILKFYDNEILKTDNYSPSKNSIKKYFIAANPYEGDLLEKADPKVLEELYSLTDNFNDALNNVAFRKASTFVSKAKSGKEPVPDDTKTSTPTKYSAYQDAVSDLTRQGYDPKDVNALVTRAWDDLIEKDKKNPDEITKDIIINKVRNTEEDPETPTPTLQPTEPSGTPTPSVSTAEPTAPVSTTGGTEPEPAKVTAPVSTTEPTAPVSSPEPTAPVSNAGKEKKRGFTPRVRQEGGELVYIDDKGYEFPMDDDQVLNRIRTDLKRKNPHFLKALTDAGLYNKYKELANQRSKTEEIINPFQKSNFLY